MLMQLERDGRLYRFGTDSAQHVACPPLCTSALRSMSPPTFDLSLFAFPAHHRCSIWLQ